MKKRKRDKEVLPSRMNPMEERGQSNRLFVEAVPVWYIRNGQVNPECFLHAKKNATLAEV